MSISTPQPSIASAAATSTTATPHGLDRVARAVARTRRGLLATVLTTGLVLAIATALAWVVGGVLLDLAAPLPVAGRIAVLAGWCVAVALAAAAFVLLPALRRPSIDAVALRIERALGGMHNRLLTVVDLARGAAPTDDAPRTLRPRLVDRLLAETQERMRGFRTRQVVPWRALGRALAWVAACVGGLALLHATLGERLAVTLDRLRQPTADIPPATWLQVESPGDIEVLSREPFTIEARVARGSADTLDLVLIDAAGRPARQPMAPGPDGTFSARLEGFSEAVHYRLEGGGTWTRTHAIAVVPRPELLALERRIRLPDYMRIDTPLSVDAEQRRIEAPVGSTIEWEAFASAEAVAGAITLSERTSVAEVVERFDDRVWFEDDLPRDAVAEVPWRWTTAQAAGGLRSFTFGSDRPTLSMRTRLEPLVLPKDRLEHRAVSVMARLDASATPTWLIMALEHGRGRTEIVWGDATAAPPAGKARRFDVGPLPAPGAWERLVAPLGKLGDLAGATATGVTFTVDGGRIHLDRPGWMERIDETVQRAIDTPVGSIPLSRQDERRDHDPLAAAAGIDPQTAPGAGRWIGAIPLDRPLRAALEVSSARGDRNLPDPPTELVPSVDRPPAIVVRDVPETLTLDRPDDVPVSGAAFDDWGVDRIEVRVGPDAKRLGAPERLVGIVLADRPPDTQASLPPVITAEQLGLDAGVSVAWQVVVVDTKGQTTESPVFRVVVKTPPEMELARSQVPGLAEARRAAEQFARDAARTADALAARREEALAAVGDEARTAVADARKEQDEQPQAPTPQQRAAAAEQAAREAIEKLDAKDRKRVAEASSALEKQRRTAEDVAQKVQAAAQQARTSDLVPAEQKARLDNLNDEARALADALAPKPSFEDEAALVDQLEAATPPGDVAEAARDLAAALADVERQLDEAGAAMQLSALARDLDRRAERLGELAREETPAKPAAMPESAARAESRDQIGELREILGKAAPPESTASAEDSAAAAAAAETTSVAEAAAAAEAAEAAADRAARLAERLAQQSPGRQPSPGEPADAVQAPQPPVPPRPSDAAAESADTADAADASAKPSLDTAEVRDALAMAQRARSVEARAAREAARAAREQREMAGKPDAESGQTGEPGQPNQSGQSDQAGQPGQADQPGQPPTQQAATDPSGKSSEGGALLGAGGLASPLQGLDAAQRAAVEALPPRVRESLLEGMRQRGPEAYRATIDAYFRALGKELPR